MTNPIRVGCSPLTKTIYAGRLNKKDGTLWSGEKYDVTSDVIGAIIDYVGVGFVNSVSVNGEPAYEIEVRAAGKLPAGVFKTELQLPPDETPVLALVRGTWRKAELRWENPHHEDTHKPFRYWDDPDNDGQDWDWDDVTHWTRLPNIPETTK